MDAANHSHSLPVCLCLCEPRLFLEWDIIMYPPALLFFVSYQLVFWELRRLCDKVFHNMGHKWNSNLKKKSLCYPVRQEDFHIPF